MIRLNLIPEEYTQKPPSALPAILVVLVAFGLVAFWIYTDFSKLRGQITATDTELAQISAKIKEKEDIENQIRVLNERQAEISEQTQIINTVVLSRLLWSRKLFQMCYLVPEKIWLTKVQAATERAGFSTRRVVEPDCCPLDVPAYGPISLPVVPQAANGCYQL